MSSLYTLQRIPKLLLIGLLVLASTLVTLTPARASADASSILINEIHYNPDIHSELVEFIELYNNGPQSIDLSAWTLSSGVDFFFPAGTRIAPYRFLVIAQNPVALRAKFGVSALGPYVHKLASQGDEIILRDNQANVVDQVTYGFGFPWPITGDTPGYSIQLIHPALDNALAGSWRSGPPTPGWVNSTLVDDPPPDLELVQQTPQAPTAQDVVKITVKATDADGVSNVILAYQLVAPGHYITLHDSAYATQWTTIPMTRMGDDTFMVDMPAETRQHRYLVRYRIQAVDTTGRVVTVPYPDDPQPNFAYFVYNGIPPWSGAIHPGDPAGFGRVQTYDFNAMRPLAVYQFIAKQADVENAQFIPNSPRLTGYMGDDYPWLGTLVYNGQVYDHVGFRARGGVNRYSVGKNMWKFNFNRGHRFQAYDNYGRPYAVKWDKLNFSAAIQNANRGHRGEQGMFESLGMRLYNMAGVEASNTQFVHYRVIDQASEYTNQYNSDFWGLYLGIQEIDGYWLDEHHLPDGNLYKMENGTGTLNNQGFASATDKSDLNGFLNGYTAGNPDITWWRQNFDLERYYSYRSILELLHNYDQDQGKNYLYYLNPETYRWSMHPWDLDLTWADTMFGQGREPFRDRILPHPEFNIEYQNRLRELRDLLFNPDQMFPMIDEQASLINSPADGLAMVDADRALWDYNPILVSRYVVRERASYGRFYQKPPSHDFRGMVQIMKDWVVSRGAWVDRTLLTDTYLPSTPGVGYLGPANYPADQLIFQPSGFGDPNGTFAAIQWRAAEVAWPGLPGYQPNAPNRYEINASWESAALPNFTPTITIPAGACQPGHLCRVRVRMKNNFGRWSHWSGPLEFVVGAPLRSQAGSLKISELMYHPPQVGNVPDIEYEFIEFKNVSSAPIDLSNMHFTGGVGYRFPLGAQLAPGEYLVLARNAQRFQERYGFRPFGEYTSKLSDKGELLTLLDAFEAPVVTFTYGDKQPWPESADGQGFTLVLKDPEQTLDPNDSGTWRASTIPYGSPGSDEPVPVVINEVLTNNGAGQPAAVEFYNPSERTAAIGGWVLTINTSIPQRYTFPAETNIPAGGYLVVSNETLGFHFDWTSKLVLSATYRGGKIGGYRHSFTLTPTPPGVSLGRYVDSQGAEHFTAQSAVTLGQANGGPLVGPVVISAIRHRPDDGMALVELTNISSEVVKLYDPDQPANTWRLQGLFYPFPSGVEIPAYGKVVITSLPAKLVCTEQRVGAGMRVLGPFPKLLATNGQYLALVRPGTPDSFGEIPSIIVDEVHYADSAPWPSASSQTLLARVTLNAYGNDPVNWHSASVTETIGVRAATVPPVAICSFTVLPHPEGGLEIAWATSNEVGVQGFNLWRSADGVREHAELITPSVIAAQVGDAQGANYTVTDTTAQVDIPYTYWLEVVNTANDHADLLFTTPETAVTFSYMPMIHQR